MSLLNHIYNIKNIVNSLVKHKDEPNKYDKVSNLFKGATVGTPELIDEVKKVINEEAKKACAYLDKKKAELQKLQAEVKG